MRRAVSRHTMYQISSRTIGFVIQYLRPTPCCMAYWRYFLRARSNLWSSIVMYLNLCSGVDSLGRLGGGGAKCSRPAGSRDIAPMGAWWAKLLDDDASYNLILLFALFSCETISKENTLLLWNTMAHLSAKNKLHATQRNMRIIPVCHSTYWLCQ